MIAFFVAGMGVLATFVWCMMTYLVNKSSLSSHSVILPWIVGLLVSGMIAASHWLPQMGW